MSQRFALITATCLFLGPATAWAGLEVCNDTPEAHDVAVAQKEGETWETRGWFSLQPEACLSVLPDALTERFYYLRVESDDWDFGDDGITFCVGVGSFTIRGDKDCRARGFRRAAFARLDVGQGTTDHSARLSDVVMPKGTAELNRAAAQSGRAFSADVTFQSCDRNFLTGLPSCKFVNHGVMYIAKQDGRSDDAVFSFLRGMRAGAPLQVSGVVMDQALGFAEVMLTQAELREMTVEDEVLMQLQGRWTSLDDQNDRFEIKGAERQNSYFGAETLLEVISVQDSCEAEGEEGLFLMATGVEGGATLCYEIAFETPDELVLYYLSGDSTLRYKRLD